MKPRILVVDDERNIRASLKLTLGGEGFDVREAATGEDAIAALKTGSIDAVFLDVKLPGIDGMETLAQIRSSLPTLPVIMISGHATLERAIEATRLGAFDFLQKPFSRERVLLVARNATESAKLRRENQLLRGDDEILGECQSIVELNATITRVAKTGARVLILGESGTGKELVARALHEQSDRSAKPFIRVNCAAIPDELIESELFGAEKGAYTGAQEKREGRFAAADGGTLLLDEIGDMSLRAQVKVLRVLQEGEFEAVGSTKSVHVDVRVLAATHQDLPQLVSEGRFREDLLYRLNVIPLQVPPLRKRGDDIELLVENFIASYATRHEISTPTLEPAALKLLRAYRWPGNIRELKNLVERLVILSDGSTIGVDALPSEFRAASPNEVDARGVNPYAKLPLKDAKDALERDLIGSALAEFDGNVTQAARALGLERTHLHKRIRALGIDN